MTFTHPKGSHHRSSYDNPDQALTVVPACSFYFIGFNPSKPRFLSQNKTPCFFRRKPESAGGELRDLGQLIDARHGISMRSFFFFLQGWLQTHAPTNLYIARIHQPRNPMFPSSSSSSPESSGFAGGSPFKTTNQKSYQLPKRRATRLEHPKASEGIQRTPPETQAQDDKSAVVGRKCKQPTTDKQISQTNKQSQT